MAVGLHWRRPEPDQHGTNRPTLGFASGDAFPEDPNTVQLRVVTDQPWDVAADVLVVPVVGEPDFDGPLGELDRRSRR